MKNRKIWALLLAFIMVFSMVASAASTYTVAKGDVLWKIAKANDTTWQELAKINNLKNPNLIYAGQTLTLKEEGTKPTEPTEPTKPTEPTEPTKPTEPTEPTEPTKPTEPPVSDGAKTATGSAKGFGGDLTLEATVDGGKITDVKVLTHKETVGIGTPALEKIPAAMVEKQSLAIDTIAGATYSSKAVLAAAEMALKALGCDVEKLKTKTETKPETPTETGEKAENTDVVIIGAGGAGMSAALEAKYAGKKVILLEKLAMVGGTSAIASTNFIAADSKTQKEKNVTYTADMMIKALVESSKIPLAPATALAKGSGPAADWLLSLGADLTRVDNNRDLKPADGSSPGVDVVKTLKKELDNQKIDYRVNSRATEILMNGDAVSGVKVHSEKGDYIIHAPAVIVATGGYAANAEWVEKHQPNWKGFKYSCSVGNTGDGILMAEKIGAEIDRMEFMSSNPSIHFADNGALASLYAVRTQGAIMVNREGRRFVDETSEVNGISIAINSTEEGNAYLIFDKSLLEKNQAIRDMNDKGYFIEANSIEELAEKIQVNKDNFVKTVNDYKGYVKSGVDTEFKRAKSYMQVDFSADKFYASLVGPAVQSTRGGIAINMDSQALDTYGNVIGGLFAAGETAYTGITTGSLPTAVVFGRIAGKNAGTVHTANAFGNNDFINVSVIMKDGKIADVKIASHGETKFISDVAIEQIPKDIVKYQTTNVDKIAGATLSSNAIISATEKAIEASGAKLADFQKAAPATVKTNKTLSETYDLVIVGAGGAGLSAAATAAQSGAKVIVLEKMAMMGGNTVRSGGLYNTSDPVDQPKQGIVDSPDNHFKNTYEGGGSVGDKNLIRTYVDNAYPSLLWLKEIGIKFEEKIFQGTGALFERSHQASEPAGTPFIQYPYDAAIKNGAKVVVNTEATELIVDASGKVTGVKAVNQYGDTITYTGTKGVILATGGYGVNVEMRTEFNPQLDASIPSTNHPGATGDGIVMAKKIGADVVGMKWIQVHPLTTPGSGALNGRARTTGATNPIIVVNQSGARFMNEGAGRDVQTAAILKQPDGIVYEINDSQCMGKINQWGENVELMISMGRVFKADTLEEVAKLAGIDPAGLVKEVASWNAMVAAKKDTVFGRILFDKPIQQGPFYAVKRAPSIHHTMGGLKINTSAQVLNTNGGIIPNLFAAGEVTGGIHGNNRLGGNALSDMVVFGRIAAKTALGLK